VPTIEEIDGTLREAQPVGLVLFAIDDWTLRVAASDKVETFNGHDWLPVAVTMPDIVQAAELRKNDLTLTVPVDFPVAQLWAEAPPAGTMLCILYDADRGSTETRDSWTGHVSNVRFASAAKAEIQLTSGLNALRQPGLRQIAQRSCRHGIYTPGCTVSPEDFKTDAVVTDRGGLWIEADEFASKPDGYYEGGFVRWTNAMGFRDWRHVRTHVGKRLTLAWSAGRLPIGGELTAHPGCDETPNDCGPKFDNLPNYGGLWWLKTKNPFGSDPVY